MLELYLNLVMCSAVLFFILSKLILFQIVHQVILYAYIKGT